MVYRIVGLVGDTRYRDLHEDPVPIIFVDEYQIADPGTDSTFLVHSNVAPSALIASLKDMATQTSPAIVLNFSVFRTSVLEKLTRERLMATLSGFYGVLAAVLAMVGIYGIISYMVVRRRNEIGVRIALGAGKANVLGMILREALALLAIGLVAGTGLAAAAGSAARSHALWAQADRSVDAGACGRRADDYRRGGQRHSSGARRWRRSNAGAQGGMSIISCP